MAEAETQELIDKLRDSSLDSYSKQRIVRQVARDELIGVVPAVTELLDDRDQYLRREVLSAIRALQAESAVPALIEALADDDYAIRQQAAECLGEFGDSGALEPLAALEGDMFHSVRDAATAAVEKIKSRPAAVPTPPKPEPQLSEPEQAEEPPASEVATEPESAPDAPENEPEPAPEASPEAEPMQVEKAPAAEAAPETPPPLPQPEQPEPEEETPEPEQSEAETETPEPEAEADEAPAPPPEPEPQKPARPRPSQSGDLIADVFGDTADAYRRRVSQLAEARSQHPELQRMRNELTNKLQLLHADRDDDIEAVGKAVKAAKKMLKGKEEIRSDLRREITELAANRSKWWYRLASTMLLRDQEEANKLDEDARSISSLGSVIEKAKEKLQEGRNEIAQLWKPIREVEQQISDTDAMCKENAELIESLNHELRIMIIDAFYDCENAEFHGELLVEGSADTELTRIALDELRTYVADRDRLNDAFYDQQEDLAEMRGKATAETARLGAALSEGFHVEEEQRSVNAKLSGSVSFSGRTSGTANGSGSGTAKYTLQRPQWQATANLGVAVEGFTQNWQAIGRLEAEQRQVSDQRAASHRGIAEFADFLRAELEGQTS
jgi:hypothetical protein